MSKQQNVKKSTLNPLEGQNGRGVGLRQVRYSPISGHLEALSPLMTRLQLMRIDSKQVLKTENKNAFQF